MKRRVLLVDDHVAVRQGLRDILSEEIRDLEFVMAENSAEALDRATAEPWHLSIVDLDLPGGRGGMELIRLLKELNPTASVLVYSMHSEEQFGIRAIKAGADGYLSKAGKTEEIIRGVRSLLAGERYITPRLASAMADALVQPKPESAHELLSDREFQVLRALASGASTTQISLNLALSPKTVSTYRTRVLEKLSLKTTAELIRYAIEHGLV